jgi:hypothetical protein
VVAAATMLVSAAPAEASPLGDCFERIAVAVRPHHHAPAVHRATPAVHKVHRVGKPHRRLVHRAVAHPVAPTLMQTQYIVRPKACGTHEADKPMTPVLGAFVRNAPETLMEQLAGPPMGLAGPPEAPPPPAAPQAASFGGIPFINGASGGSGGGGGGPTCAQLIQSGAPLGASGCKPEVVTPPPVDSTPPPVDGTPPIDTPPPPPPGDGTPPIITPPPPPPGGTPPIDTPPGPPGPPGGPPGVPEPATWAMLILGFGAIGATLRVQRRQRSTATAQG